MGQIDEAKEASLRREVRLISFFCDLRERLAACKTSFILTPPHFSQFFIHKNSTRSHHLYLKSVNIILKKIKDLSLLNVIYSQVIYYVSFVWTLVFYMREFISENKLKRINGLPRCIFVVNNFRLVFCTLITPKLSFLLYLAEFLDK